MRRQWKIEAGTTRGSSAGRAGTDHGRLPVRRGSACERVSSEAPGARTGRLQRIGGRWRLSARRSRQGSARELRQAQGLPRLAMSDGRIMDASRRRSASSDFRSHKGW